LFASGVTVADIEGMNPEARHATRAMRAELDAILDRLAKLGAHCRQQSLSLLVPMGQEMSYRYQEQLIADLTRALKAFRAKLEG
jgi:hypothetical protein